MATVEAPAEPLRNLVEVIRFCKEHDLPADVVGRWVWIRFEQKPSEETRALLKAAGFRWIHKRGQWAHNCGYFCHHGHGNPRYKYGEMPVSAFTEDDLAGV